MLPLVSIVTPTYNYAKYIGRCIESLLSQTYTNWEQIIVDDGSTDNTEEVVKSYNDTRITYIREVRRGVGKLAETMNVGFRKSKGELFTAIMSDDMWPSYRLEKQVPIFEDSKVVLCFGRQVLIDVNDKVIGERPTASYIQETMNRPVGSVFHELLINNFIPQPTVLIRREALENIGGYLQPPGLLAEDYPTHLELAKLGEFRYLDLELGYYRMHPHQQTRNIILEMRKTDSDYVRKYFETLEPEFKILSGWTKSKLEKKLIDIYHSGYFAEGRRQLLNGNRLKASKLFIKAVLKGDLRTKINGSLGLVCAIIGIDLEGIARIFKKGVLK